jgi:transposase
LRNSYVKRQKNDMADAEAICEAVTRANMRFVPTKTPEQQSCLMLHRARHLFIRQQTAVINSIRAHLAEFGTASIRDARPVTEGSLAVRPLIGRLPEGLNNAGNADDEMDSCSHWRIGHRTVNNRVR